MRATMSSGKDGDSARYGHVAFVKLSVATSSVVTVLP